MTDGPALAENVLSLLDESARTSTYKSALMPALLDRAQEHLEDGTIPVRNLAERVIELYWPQTLEYPDHGVLLQNQGNQATIVRAITEFRLTHKNELRFLPTSLRIGPAWDGLVDEVELTLAEWPIPRLQRPLAPFIYRFDWTWAEQGGWSVRRYKAGSRSVQLFPGVATSLVSIGPLLRPFITRWWTDKAAQLNPNVRAAQSLKEFEDFLFETERKRLEPVAEPLLDLQTGKCFYCGRALGKNREIDHFVAWSRTGDDGLDNLVGACQPCNNNKRTALAGSTHLARLLERNVEWSADLAAIANERQWLRDPERSAAARRSAYLIGSRDRPLWRWTGAPGMYDFSTVGAELEAIKQLLAPAA